MLKLRFVFVFVLLSFVFHAQQSANYIDSLKRVIKTTSIDTVKVDAMNKLANSHRYNSPDSALLFARKGLTLAKQIKYKKGTADAFHIIASAHTNQSNYDSALFYCKKALFIRERINDKRGISTSNNNIGLIYYNQGIYEKAVKYYLISSKMDEQLDDKEGMAISLNNIGLIYMNQNNYPKTLEYFDMALAAYLKLGKKVGIAGCYANIAGVYYYQKKLDESVVYFEKALALYQEIGNDRFIASMYTNLGEVLADLKRYKEAIDYIKKSIAIETRLENGSGLCYAQLALAKMQINIKSFLAAEGTLLEAKKTARAINANKQLSAALQMLASVYANTGKYKEAYNTSAEFTNVNDSILNSDNNSQITEMTTKYESDRKSREIELLKKQKEIQKLQRAAEESRSRIIRNGLIAGFVILLFVAGLIYNRYQLKKKANLLLHQKNEDINLQNEKIQLQSSELSEKNKEITDSILYAKRIQKAILPPEDLLKKAFKEHFILYKPKDIVSGDFYWLHEKEDKVLVAAVDCTGHGVPGALMSVIGSSTLDQIATEETSPDIILNKLNKSISINLQQRSQDIWLKDGMDIALCSIDKKKKTLLFSGAMNSAYIVRNKEVHELDADKIIIGNWGEIPGEHYKIHEYPLMDGDMIYLFTDGYGDQFGGPKGKKFKIKNLVDLCCQLSDKPAADQLKSLNTAFENWRGDIEQIDDVTIVGIRI